MRNKRTQRERNKGVFRSISLFAFIMVFVMWIDPYGIFAAPSDLLPSEFADTANSSDSQLLAEGEDITYGTSEADDLAALEAKKLAEQSGLILVNRDNHIPFDFTVDLTEVDGFRVSVLIADPLTEMMEAAKQAGAPLTLTSAYRNVATQRILYNNKVAEYLDLGYNYVDSVQKAERFVQPPGASEHHTGLAVDFYTFTGSVLSQSFGNTEQYKWLSENAHLYGFIERYGKNDESLTGIAWEPWHYRFVGVEAATYIVENDLILEQYLEDLTGGADTDEQTTG